MNETITTTAAEPEATASPTVAWREYLATLKAPGRHWDADREAAKRKAQNWQTCAVGRALNLEDLDDSDRLASSIGEMPYLHVPGINFACAVNSGHYEAAAKHMDEIDKAIEHYGGPAETRRRIWRGIPTAIVDDAMRYAVKATESYAACDPEPEYLNALRGRIDAMNARIRRFADECDKADERAADDDPIWKDLRRRAEALVEDAEHIGVNAEEAEEDLGGEADF